MAATENVLHAIEHGAALERTDRVGPRERGLVRLYCGSYGNVLRVLVPFAATDEDLDRGLEIMEESLGHAIAELQ